MNTYDLSKRFIVFANRECRASSQLYEHLAKHIAHDKDLLEIAAHSQPGQPVPNLLLGSVHYLLLNGIEHELAAYYASMTETPLQPSGAIHFFRDFCIRHRSLLIYLLKSKIVQTNEVRRCAYLYPSFCRVFAIAQKPLSLIEIGTSAGLQLVWDQYSYSYSSIHNQTFGGESSKLRLSAETIGNIIPLMSTKSPLVERRIGIDPVEFIQGDGVTLLPALAATVSRDTALCIFHTHVANQMSDEAKKTLNNHIQGLCEAGRDVFHLYNNMQDFDLHLDYHLDGNMVHETLATTDGHGRWFEWKVLHDHI